MNTRQDPNEVLLLCGSPKVSYRTPQREFGAVVYLQGIEEGFERNGFRISRFVFGDYVPLGQKGSLGKRSRTAPWWWWVVDLIRLGVRPFLQLWVRMRFRNACPALVFEQYAPFQALGRVFQEQGVPWILATHSLMYEEAFRDMGTLKLWRLERFFELRAYRDADALVVISEDLKEKLVAVGIPREKIHVMPNGVSVRRMNPFRVVQPFRMYPVEKWVVGFLGRFYPWQGLETLLLALHTLRNEMPDLRVVLVGDGPEEASLREKIRSLRLMDRVRIFPPVTLHAAPRWMMGFDVGYTSPRDAFRSPLKLYEYLSLGLPVVAAETEDIRRFWKDVPGVWVFPYGDVDALVEKLRAMYAHRNALRMMGMQARERVLAHHTWEVRIRSLLHAIAHETSPEGSTSRR